MPAPRSTLAAASLLLALAARPAGASFHFAVIDELMASHAGDASVQFVEIRMLLGGQNFVADSVLAAFDATGAYVGDLLVVPDDLAVGAAGTRWLMGTTAFETAAGVQADFEFSAGLPLGGGMVCWGAPGVSPPNPASWDHANPANYVDCVAYGAYTGPSNPRIGNPTPLLPEGHSLERLSETGDNASDFDCADAADPTNDAGAVGSLAATTPCPEPGAALLLLAGWGTLRGVGRRPERGARRSRAP
jgi:hypothetical protein